MGMDVGKKIREARKAARLSQEQLTDACGWEHQSRISGYETGKREPSFEDLAIIAKAVGLKSAEALLTGDAKLVAGQSAASKADGRVPVISWVAAGRWCESPDTFEPGDADEWLECPFPHSKSSIYLKVIGDSMFSDYSEGEYILVDPEIPAEHGNDVVVRTPDGKYTFKRLQITPEGTYLLALNPDHPNRKIQIPADSQVCGVVTSSLKKRR